jgi:septum site-determining protein MinC
MPFNLTPEGSPAALDPAKAGPVNASVSDTLSDVFPDPWASPGSEPVPAAENDSVDRPAVILSPTERATQSGHIFFKTDRGLLYLHLPSSRTNPVEWSSIWEQLQQRLEASQRIWPPNTPVHLVANDRLLDQRQLDRLASALSEAHLSLKRVLTSRRQTAIAAVSSGYSVDQQSPTLTLAADPVAGFSALPDFVLAEPLYLETTLRSGSEVRHPGSVILVGDTNPGSAIIADGDILVWGRLRGVAHAGAHGDRGRQIMALQLEPTQIRIADQVARTPAQAPHQVSPEVAYVVQDGIQIMRAAEYYRRKSNSRPDV